MIPSMSHWLETALLPPTVGILRFVCGAKKETRIIYYIYIHISYWAQKSHVCGFDPHRALLEVHRYVVLVYTHRPL